MILLALAMWVSASGHICKSFSTFLAGQRKSSCKEAGPSGSFILLHWWNALVAHFISSAVVRRSSFSTSTSEPASFAWSSTSAWASPVVMIASAGACRDIIQKPMQCSSGKNEIQLWSLCRLLPRTGGWTWRWSWSGRTRARAATSRGTFAIDNRFRIHKSWSWLTTTESVFELTFDGHIICLAQNANRPKTAVQPAHSRNTKCWTHSADPSVKEWDWRRQSNWNSYIYLLCVHIHTRVLFLKFQNELCFITKYI